MFKFQITVVKKYEIDSRKASLKIKINCVLSRTAMIQHDSTCFWARHFLSKVLINLLNQHFFSFPPLQHRRKKPIQQITTKKIQFKMSQVRLPILADFLFLHQLLSDKNIDHQSFEAISSLIQKKFNRNDFLSE
jgi:hypothetical protein